ncbi:MAG: glucose 1-dehydrogenase [Bryobacterales bacterium]|nr:glucose 1-dehydrogenase [Bryobacterales bacterium]
MKLKGKVALVTGGSKGIGAAIAERLAQEGAAVAVNYSRGKAEAAAVVSRIQAAGGKAVALGADLREEPAIVHLFEEAARELGPLDILVNNAGIYEFAPVEFISAEHIDKHFTLNVRTLVLATREAVKAFGDRGGAIINLSSVVAQSPVPAGSVYSSTKAAVDNLTKGFAQELAPRKILVNAIAPGFVETEGAHGIPNFEAFKESVVAKTALGRTGKPRDIAAVAAFLASDDAAWVTGQIISADGGLRL